MEAIYRRAGTKRSFAKGVRVFVYATLLVAALVFILPFTQHLNEVSEQRKVRTIDVAMPPPPPPPPEPPPPQEDTPQESPPELKQQPKPLSLSQLELAMNPGMGDAVGAAFSVGGFDVESNALEELQTFSVAELDERPRLMRQPSWTWPRHAIGRVREDVKAYAFVVITEKGTVEFQRFRDISDSIVEAELIKHVEGFRFSVPQKGGKPVRARFAIPIELAKP